MKKDRPVWLQVTMTLAGLLLLLVIVLVPPIMFHQQQQAKCQALGGELVRGHCIDRSVILDD